MRRNDLHTPSPEAAERFERIHGIEPLPRDVGITVADVPYGPSEGCWHKTSERDCLVCAFRRVMGGAA